MNITHQMYKVKLRLFISLILSIFALSVFYYIYLTFYESSSTPRSLNISVFAYRDINRNGFYDSDDRPYAGLEIMMERPNGGPVNAKSNISGFSNFKMSFGEPQFDVYEAGQHQIKAKPAKGWIITSNNFQQTVKFVELEEAPVKIVTEKTFEPVGVAPELSISGQIKLDNSKLDASLLSMEAATPNSGNIQVVLSNNGTYSFPATVGDWKLVIFYNGEVQTERKLVVSNYAVKVSKIELGSTKFLSLPTIQQIGFDDLTPSDTLIEVPNGYKGLNWTNWVATHQKLYRGYGFINSTISSEYIAYNSSGHPAVVWSNDAFDFVGGFIGVAWPDAEKHDVIIKAWRNGVLAFEDRIKASIAGPVYFDANYRNISRLEFSSAAYWQIVVDDLIVRKAVGEHVEE